MVRILPGEAVRSVIDLADVLDVVADALAKQRAGAVERPDRPHFPIGVGLDPDDPTAPTGTGLVMPAYVHGAPYVATKLVGVHEANPDRGLPTVTAQIVLDDATTGLPVAYLEGKDITGARTGAIGGLAARTFTEGPIRVGVIGAGTQARWQLRAIDAAVQIESVSIYGPTPARVEEAIETLVGEIDARMTAAESPEEAVKDVDLVVTATTSTEPVFPGDALAPGTVVVAVGAYTPDMQEIDTTTLDRAAIVFADVPEEVATIGDATAAGLGVDDLVPFADALAGEVARDSSVDVVVVESVGSAVMDAATAAYVYDRAVEAGAGTEIDF